MILPAKVINVCLFSKRLWQKSLLNSVYRHCYCRFQYFLHKQIQKNGMKKRMKKKCKENLSENITFLHFSPNFLAILFGSIVFFS